MMFRGVNLVMAALGFAMSALFISFLCIRLIVAHIQLAASRRALSTSSANQSSVECGFGGLEPHVIAKIPSKKYSDASFNSSDDSQCVICLAEFCKESTLRILPYCGHFFHVLCIDKWLHQHLTCPVCRISLREFPKKCVMPPMYSSSIRPYVNPYSCLSAIQNRGHTDCLIDPIHENLLQTQSLGGETGESISVIIEGPKHENAESSSTT